MKLERGRLSDARSKHMTLALKRTLDVLASAAGLVLLSPIFLVIAAAIKANSVGPVFFRQERVGRDGKNFQIVKFRSMVAAAPNLGGALTTSGDSRITPVGAFIRWWKLDELPQLLNVLKGEMSLVGPRPEVRAFLDFYTPEQRASMLSVRPGMTDYAAILFRDESRFLDGKEDPVEVYRREIMPRKIACYERYVQELSVIGDLRIILATVTVLAAGRFPKGFGIETEFAP
jgi:lipopolysaccharide/colanic/teichoic acid biosynthesis glycosyltransferase